MAHSRIHAFVIPRLDRAEAGHVGVERVPAIRRFAR
jgi:hypothetical protein